MPNITVLIIMIFIFAASVFTSARIAKRFPEYPLLPALGWVVGVALFLAVYVIGKAL